MTTLPEIDLTGSRFSIHENPNVAPGNCAVCRHSGGDGRYFVDFGLQLDWYGAVYFCSECVRELAGAIGYVPIEDLNLARREAKDNLKVAGGMKKEFDAFRYSTSVLLRDCRCNLGASDCGDGVGTPQISGIERSPQRKSAGSDRKDDETSGSE